MIKLRLRRMGAKKRPFYRLVAAEHSSPRDGRFIEVLGHYDPLADPAIVTVNAERVRYWLSVGAQPSPTVEGILKKEGIIAADKTYYPKAQKRDKAATDASGKDDVVETDVEDVTVEAEPVEAPAEEEVVS